MNDESHLSLSFTPTTAEYREYMQDVYQPIEEWDKTARTEDVTKDYCAHSPSILQAVYRMVPSNRRPRTALSLHFFAESVGGSTLVGSIASEGSRLLPLSAPIPPAKKRDLTRLIPDSLIPDILIPFIR